MAGNSTKQARRRKRERKNRREDRKYGKPERPSALVSQIKRPKKIKSNQVVPYVPYVPFEQIEYDTPHYYISDDDWNRCHSRIQEWLSLDAKQREDMLMEALYERVENGCFGDKMADIILGSRRRSEPTIIEMFDETEVPYYYRRSRGPVITELDDDVEIPEKKKPGKWKRFKNMLKRVFCCGKSQTQD